MSDKWTHQQATAEQGPVSVNQSGVTWQEHLAVAGLLLALLIGAARLTAAIGSERLTEIETKRAFCAEIDQRFVSSHYYFDEDLLECRVSEDGDNG